MVLAKIVLLLALDGRIRREGYRASTTEDRPLPRLTCHGAGKSVFSMKFPRNTTLCQVQ